MAGNSLQPYSGNKPDTGKVQFTQWIASVNVQKTIATVISDQRTAQKFVSSLCSVVATNPTLKECDYGTVLSAALLATSLGLSLSPSIGHCYIVPFNDKKKGKVATFILGWRGYIQLATRTGYYDRIHVVAIKEGEVVSIDPVNDEYVFAPIQDPEKREMAKTVGYYAFFKYNERSGGFRKHLYWSREKMLHHADRYSQAFHLEAVKSNDPSRARVSFADYEAGKYPKEDEWKYSSFWYKDFDAMAMKTMVRQLIGKWGIMNSDFLQAYEADGNYLETSDGVTTVQSISEENAEPVELPNPIGGTNEENDRAYEGGVTVDEDGVVSDVKPDERRRRRKPAASAADSASVQEDFFGAD